MKSQDYILKLLLKWVLLWELVIFLLSPRNAHRLQANLDPVWRHLFVYRTLQPALTDVPGLIRKKHKTSAHKQEGCGPGILSKKEFPWPC